MSAIVRMVKKYGNSGGVYLPRGWIGGTVRAELIDEPKNPLADIARLLPLTHVIAIIAYGSHARREPVHGSDIDMLVVVDDDGPTEVPDELRSRYDIQIVTESEIIKIAANDPLWYTALADDAVALLNHTFLDGLRKEKPKVSSVAARLDLAASSLAVTKELAALEPDPRRLVYPLMLRLKETVLLGYFIAGKKYTTRALQEETTAGGISSKEAALLIAIYRAARDNKPLPKTAPNHDILQKLIALLEMKIAHVRKTAREKRH